MIDVGVSVVEITPPSGLAMSGFAVRNEPATGAHDPLTIRALVVGDTAIAIADVIGIDAALSKRVRQCCKLDAGAVTITATHTHGGPPSMPARLAATPDAAFLQKLEQGLIKAINDAEENKKPAKIFGGVAVDPGYAKNRRHENGPVDQMIPVLRFDDSNGKPLAIFISYACHPVVLGAGNLQWTADYVHFLRKELETAYPGATAIFATGCAGDVNTGHTAADSMSILDNPDRTFTTAAKMGAEIASSVKAARLSELGASVGYAEMLISLDFSSTEPASADELTKIWQIKAEQENSDIYRIWAEWARTTMGCIEPLSVRCTALNWGGVSIVALPGEIFAETAISLRETLPKNGPNFVLSYADDNPGYIPPASEYDHGGYEIEEAHRFYGLGAAFAPGSAERLAKTGCECAQNAEAAAKENNLRN
ncbi:MAG: neutral/alkaline non-lysosomal ceramidase N-terminal domain-containing protein [Paracoccaceae bacterium]